MTVIRVRWEKRGGHVHCRLFTARAVNQTFANCGDLVFSVEEWPEVVFKFSCGGIEVLPDTDRGG